MYTTSVWKGDAAGEARPPHYVPYASGTPAVYHGLIDDTDDAAVIAAQLCPVVWKLDLGGAAAQCLCDAGPAASCAIELPPPLMAADETLEVITCDEPEPPTPLP